MGAKVILKRIALVGLNLRTLQIHFSSLTLLHIIHCISDVTTIIMGFYCFPCSRRVNVYWRMSERGSYKKLMIKSEYGRWVGRKAEQMMAIA